MIFIGKMKASDDWLEEMEYSLSGNHFLGPKPASWVKPSMKVHVYIVLAIWAHINLFLFAQISLLIIPYMIIFL